MLPQPATYHIRAFSRAGYLLQAIAPSLLAFPVAVCLPLEPSLTIVGFCLLTIVFYFLLGLFKFYRVHVVVTEQSLTCIPACRLYGRPRVFVWAEVTGFRQIDNDFEVLELWHPNPFVLLCHSKRTTGDDYGQLMTLLSTLPAV